MGRERKKERKERKNKSLQRVRFTHAHARHQEGEVEPCYSFCPQRPVGWRWLVRDPYPSCPSRAPILFRVPFRGRRDLVRLSPEVGRFAWHRCDLVCRHGHACRERGEGDSLLDDLYSLGEGWPLKREDNKDPKMPCCCLVVGVDKGGAEGHVRHVAGAGRMRVLGRRAGLGLDAMGAEVDDVGRRLVQL